MRFSSLRAGDVPMKSLVLLLAGVALLSGCDRNPAAQSPQAVSDPTFALPPLSQMDLGATLLAEVENARVAIVEGDPVAASNDLTQAWSFAVQLPDRPSKWIFSGPLFEERNRISHPHDMPRFDPPLTVFGVQVELSSAQAELSSNLEAADAHLRSIEDGIPQGSIRSDLALLRAAASLDLARIAASEGRRRDLRTQLRSAESALRAYSGAGHIEEADALQATIDQSIHTGTVDSMLSYQPSAWLFTVLKWDGAYSWNAPIR